MSYSVAISVFSFKGGRKGRGGCVRNIGHEHEFCQIQKAKILWSWVLLLPRLPPLSWNLRLFPWPSILLHGPLGVCLDLLPAAPLLPVQKRDAQHMFLQHMGGTGRYNLHSVGELFCDLNPHTQGKNMNNTWPKTAALP